MEKLNALKHGITAKTLILQNENPEHFLELQQAYMEHLKPTTQAQIDLVSDIVAARWRLRRVLRYQTAMLDIEMDAQAPDLETRYTKCDEDMRGTLAFSSLADKGKALNTAHRFEVHFNRTYRRALAEYQKLQNEK